MRGLLKPYGLTVTGTVISTGLGVVSNKIVATARVPYPNVTLAAGSHSVFSNGGTALVIHAKADDMKTDPAGNAGDRIACGVIAA